MMFLSPYTKLVLPVPHPKSLRTSSSSCRFSLAAAAPLERELEAPSSQITISVAVAKERVKNLLKDTDISVSSYDTAWVAMVPCPQMPNTPLFPKSLDWVLDNQLPDGSWSLPHHNALLLKDVLSSTLASVLALKKWGIGQKLIEKGAQFIETNFASAMDENLYSPIGFDIIFPGMLDHATSLNLNLQLESGTLNALLTHRDQQLTRCLASPSKKVEAYLAYISEGMGDLQNWDKVLKHQRKNGSLFDSPSTTAAAFIHLQNPGCFNYLNSVVEKFGAAVPTVYPLAVYARLCLVDHIERLGVSRYFTTEIQLVLNDSYRSWIRGDEEIFDDASTCALTFRLLREHGYNVSPGPLENYSVEEDCLSGTSCGESNDVGEVIELYKALEIVMHEDESALAEQRIQCKTILEKVIADDSISKQFISPFRLEVEDALKYPCHSTVQRVINRRFVERYNVNNTRLLKSSYSSSNLGNNELLNLAVEDYNQCQLIHREEVKELERWVVENRLDQLMFPRNRIAFCHFAAAATMFASEFSDARMSWAKHAFLTVMVDDLFDGQGSSTEPKKLIWLVEKWVVNADSCSEQIQILFAALRSTILETGDKASILQGWNVTSHIIEIWLDLLYSMLREAEWAKDRSFPSMDEYLSNGSTSVALGPATIPAMYLVGPKLSEAVMRHPQFWSLFNLLGMGGRVMNDIQGLERESREGTINFVTLLMNRDGMSEAEAIAEANEMVTSIWKQVVRLVVVETEGNVVPKVCKDMVLNMCKVLQLCYKVDDGLTTDGSKQLIKSIIYEPISASASVSPPASPPVKNL